jgi:hypothetical protein
MGSQRTIKDPGNQEIQEVRKSQERPQESKKTVKSQESRISRVWKTDITQESKSRRIPPNIAIFPPTRGGEKGKGKRDSSLKSMVKLSDDSSWLSLHPGG